MSVARLRRFTPASARKYIAPGVVVALIVALLPALASSADATPTPASISFTTQPGNGAPGTDLATQPAVTTLDADGHTLSTSDTISVTLKNADNSALSGLAALTCPNATADSGVATFSGCQVNRGGLYKLVAHDGSLTAESDSFFVSGPSQLAFTKQPNGGTAGQVWSHQPEVTVEDAHGDPIATSTVNIRLGIDAGTGTAGATLGCTQAANQAAASAGVATFSGCNIDRSGANYRIQAFDATDALSATSSQFDIDAGPVDHLAFGPQPGGGAGGADFAQQPVVSILDSHGNVEIGNTDQVTMSIKSGTGAAGATLTCPAQSASDGVATFAGCQIDKAGTGYVLVATDSTASKSVDSTPFDVLAGGATGISFTVEPGGGPGGAPFAQQPVVKIADAGGNGVAGTVTLSLIAPASVSGAVLSCAANPAASATGVVHFAGCSVSQAGQGFKLRATSGSFTADSHTFDVSQGDPAHLDFSTQPGDGTGGTALSTQPIVDVTDLGGNPAAGTVTLSIADGTGTPGATLSCGNDNTVNITDGTAEFDGCSIDKAGTGYRLIATSGDAQQMSEPFDVRIGDPAQLAFTTEPGGGTGGTPWDQQPVVAVQDAGGNQVPGSAASIALSITAGTGSGQLTCTAGELPAVRGAAQFDGCRIDRTASAYRLTAHDGADNLTVESHPFAVSAGAAAGLEFTGEPGSSTAGDAFAAQPSVTVVDRGGNPANDSADVTIAVTPGTGSGGTLSCDAATLSAAPAADFTGCAIDQAGSGYTLKATAPGGLHTESDPFAILLPPPSPLEQAPTNVPNAQTFGGRDLAVNPTDVADGVNTATGDLTFSREDIKVAGIGEPFDLVRTYNSADTTGGSFGPGWTSLLDMNVTIAANKQTATVRGADGQQIVFTPNPTGGWLAPAGARSSLSCNANICTVTRFDGVQFQVSGGHVVSYLSPDAMGLKFAWTATKVTITVRTTSKTPLNVTATLDSSGRVTKIASPTRHVLYGYNGAGLLSSVTDVLGHPWTYAYTGGLLTSETDPLGQDRLTARYNGAGQVVATTHQGSPQHVDDTFDWGTNTGTRNALESVNGSMQREPYVDRYVGNVLVRQTDPLGATIRYSYDNRVNLTEIQDATGWVKQYTYDARNNLIQVSSPISSTSAAVVKMTWDSQHRMLTETDADGNTTTQVYNSTAIGYVRAPGVTPGVGYTYDANFDLIRIQTSVGQEAFAYDAAGNRIGAQLQTLKGAALNGKGSAATYNEEGDRLTSVEPKGNVSPIDPNYESTWTYDAAGHLLSQTQPGGATTSFTYTAAGDPLTTTNANGTSHYSWDESTLTKTTTGPGSRVTTDTYDPSGNLLSESDTQSNRTTTYTYDAAGRETSTTDPSGVTTNYSYDLSGNVVAASDSLGDTLTRQYNSMNLPIREVNNGVETRTAWDPAGHAVSQTDADGNVTHTTYNSHGLVDTVTNGAGTTRYTYDPATDELLSTTDGNNHVTTYAYDAAQRRISMTRNGAVTKYGYDLDSNVNSITDPDGRTTSITFNGQNLPTTTTYTQTGTPTVTVNEGYDAFGRRTSMADGSGTTSSWTYDTSGNLTSAHVPGGTFTYDYSQPGKIIESYPDGTQVNYGVDDAGNIMSVESGTPGSAGYVKVSYVRDLRRQVTGVAYSNGTFETQQYDKAGNVLDQQVRNAAGALSDDQFTYDAAGNRLTQQRTVGGVTTANSYGYDTTGQLTSFRTNSGPGTINSPPLPDSGSASSPNTSSVINGGGATAAAYSVTTSVDAANGAHTTYGYDAVGNRTSLSGPAGAQSTSFDAGDQVSGQSGVGAVTWTQDKSGHVTKLGNKTMTYDAAGRLLSVTTGGSTITYRYDGDGNRISKTVGGNTTTFTWDPMGALAQLVLERQGANLIRRYFYGDGAVAMQTPSATYFLNHDPVGSTTELTDANGGLVASYTYDAFGNVTTTGNNPPVNPVLFQGQYYDSDTGLYYMRARTYDPSSGRFLSRDPAPQGVGAPAQSAFVFANNAPTVFTDPTGRSTVAAETFDGKSSAAANGTNDTKMGVTGVTLGVKATAKLGGYSAAVTEASLSAKIGADAAPELAAAAKTGSNLAKAGIGLAVIGIGLQAATTVLDCMYSDAYTCAGDVVGLTLNIAFTVGCSFVTGGVAAAACGIVGAILSTGLQIVIAKYGPQIVSAFVAAGEFYAEAFTDLGNSIADISVQAFQGASQLAQEVGGAIVSGFNSATTAISSGFDTAMKTLAAAGYSAVQFADVVGHAFVQGAEDAVADLVALGYQLSDVATAVFDVFSTTAVQFAGMLKNEFNYAANQIATALSDAYNTTAAEAAQILKDLDFAVDQVAGALQDVYNKAAAEAAQILDDIGYGFGQIADALNTVFAKTDKFVADVLHTLGATATEAIDALRDFFADADSAAAAALDFATYEVNQIAGALQSAFNTVAQRAAEIFADLSKTATQIATALNDVFHSLDTDAALILRGLNFALDDVADALRDGFNDLAQAAASALRTVGYTVVEIGNALRTEFSKLAEDAATILGNIGFDVVAIGDALKNAFSKAADEVTSILHDLTYDATAVAQALANAFTIGAQDVANYLKAVFSLSDVATALSNAFFQTAEEVAQIFKNLGEDATAIANALSSAFNEAADAIGSILKDIGETAADIAGVLENVFGEATDAIGNFLSSIGFSDSTISAIGDAFSSFGQDVADCFSSFFSDC